jgi:hypothetical protein
MLPRMASLVRQQLAAYVAGRPLCNVIRAG